MEVTRQVGVARAVHLACWWGSGSWQRHPPPPRPCKTPVRTWLSAPSTVDLLDWNSLIDSRTKLSKLLLVPNMQVGTHLRYPQSDPTGRALGLCRSGVRVRCPQALTGSSLVAVVLAGTRAVIHHVQPPRCAGQRGLGSWGWAAAPGDGLPSGVFLSPVGKGWPQQGATSCSRFRLGSWSLCSRASLRRRICR